MVFHKNVMEILIQFLLVYPTWHVNDMFPRPRPTSEEDEDMVAFYCSYAAAMPPPPQAEALCFVQLSWPLNKWTT